MEKPIKFPVTEAQWAAQVKAGIAAALVKPPSPFKVAA